MNYEKKYKEALDRAKNLHKDAIDIGEAIRAKQCEIIFPELAESKDEKIRKAILELVRQSSEVLDKQNQNNMIAWLEKQESIEEIVTRCKDSWYNEGKIQGQIEGLSDEEKYQQGWHDALEKQGEQKPAIEMKSPEESLGISSEEYNKIVDACLYDDMVEPKFHEGDWVIDNQGIVHQIANIIENVTNRTWGYDIVGGGYFNDKSDVRLWAIEDAKDGDVLATPNYIYIFNSIDKETEAVSYYCLMKKSDNHFSFGDYKIHDEILNSTPATKEQRDALEKAMKEAGYVFDFDKKELKEIGAKTEGKPLISLKDFQEAFELKARQYDISLPNRGYDIYAMCEELYSLLITQNPSWNEEDEKIIDSSVDNLTELMHRYGEEYGNVGKCIDWLKSLKERVQPQKQWKPSEEQMKVLISEVEAWTKGCPKQKVLESLYNDLKKLK